MSVSNLVFIFFVYNKQRFRCQTQGRGYPVIAYIYVGDIDAFSRIMSLFLPRLNFNDISFRIPEINKFQITYPINCFFSNLA